jgi:5'-3' exonuclease
MVQKCPNPKRRNTLNKFKYEEEIILPQKKPSVPRAPWRAKKEENAAKAGADGVPVKPKKRNKLLATMPDNWEEEEARFFETPGEYDPQFEYSFPATNKKFIKMFPEPRFEYLDTAIKIIDTFLATFGTESAYFESEGR